MILYTLWHFAFVGILMRSAHAEHPDCDAPHCKMPKPAIMPGYITTPGAIVKKPILPSGACPSPRCDSGGLSVEVYYNKNAASSTDPGTYGTGLSPDYYFPLAPLDTGFTDTLSVPYTDPGSDLQANMTYGGMTYQAYNYTLVFSGYYYAEASGNYTFCTNSQDGKESCDDIDTIYIGSGTAFPCGHPTKPPAGASSLLTCKFNNQQVCATTQLVGGWYYPIRSVYGNIGLVSSLQVQVTGPGEQVSTNIACSLYPAVC